MKHTLLFFLCLLGYSSIAQTIIGDTSVSLNTSFSIFGNGFTLANAPICTSGANVPTHSYTIAISGIKSNGDKTILSISRTATGITTSGVDFLDMKISCSDINSSIDYTSLEFIIEKTVTNYESYWYRDLDNGQLIEGIRACSSDTQLSDVYIIPFILSQVSTPTNITQSQGAICANNTSYDVQYFTSNTYSIYKWYKNGVFLVSTAFPNSPFINVKQGDKIGLKGDNNVSCEFDSKLYEINVDVTDIATLVLEPINTSACLNDSFVINSTATNYTKIEWFEDSNLTKLIASNWITGVNGTQVTIPALSDGNITYYARATNNSNCFSNVKSIVLTTNVNPVIGTIDGDGGTFCKNSIILFTAATSNTNIGYFKWYKDLAGTQEITSGITGTNKQIISYSTSNLITGTNKIYIRGISNSNCQGNIKAISFNIVDNSGTISTVSQTEYCMGDYVNLTINSLSSISYQWFEDENMNIAAPFPYLINNAKTLYYKPTSLGSRTWFYRGVNAGGCYTQVYSITVNVIDAPTNLEVTNQGASFCTNENATFEVSSTNSSSFKFYKNSNGTLLWGSSYVSGNTLSVPANILNLAENKFWVKAINSSGCETALKEVSFLVNQAPTTPLQSSGTLSYCLDETVKITVFSATANSYQWSYTSNFQNLIESSKIGNSEASLLQYQTSVVGTKTYYFRSLRNGCYSDYNSLTVTVSPQVGELVTSGDGGTFCQGTEQIELIAGASGATSGFTWWLDSAASIPATNITGTLNNTFRLTNTEDISAGIYELFVRGENSAGCNSKLQKVTYTVLESPKNLEISGETNYCTGEQVLLVPSASNATGGYQFAYDSNFNNMVEASKLNPAGALSYTALNIENTIYYYRTEHSNGCTTAVQEINVKVLQGVVDLTLTNMEAEVCKGESIQFVASAINATSFKFYDNNGAEIGSANSLTINTDDLSEGEYFYKVQGFNTNGCVSLELPFRLYSFTSSKHTDHYGRV